jgi:hypothetical protein
MSISLNSEELAENIFACKVRHKRMQLVYLFVGCSVNKSSCVLASLLTGKVPFT